MWPECSLDNLLWKLNKTFRVPTSCYKPAGANPGFALNSFVSQLKQPTDTIGLQKLCHTEN